MAYSTGSRNLVFEALSWLAAAGIIAYAVINYDTLKGSVATAMGKGADGSESAQRLTAEPAPPQQRAAGTVELKVGSDGHFHADIDVNGRSISVLVDTGATSVALTYDDAERAGIFLKSTDFKYGTQTANGVARVALTNIDTISIGDITVRNVKATVHQPGGLGQTLLGMAFLSRLSRVEMRPGTLVLHD